jgi:phospholipase D1/2
MLGTLLGMLPGILGLALLTDRIVAAVREPGLWSIALGVVTVVAVGIGVHLLRHRLRKSLEDRLTE